MMATKTTFSMNSENSSNGFQKVFDYIQASKLKVTSKSGKEYVNLPLLFAVVIAIIFPLVIVLAVALSLFAGINIIIEREVNRVSPDHKRIDIQ